MQVPFVSRWHSSGLILAIVLLLLIAPVSQGLTPTYTAADPPVSNSSEPRSEPPTIESNGPYSTGSNADRLSPSATARTIILITGSTITVQKHNNTLNYQVHEGSPVTHIKQGSKNYLIPRGDESITIRPLPVPCRTTPSDTISQPRTAGVSSN